jgi:hypothetical protein
LDFPCEKRMNAKLKADKDGTKIVSLELVGVDNDEEVVIGDFSSVPASAVVKQV